MKKMMIALLAMLTIATSGKAMSYEQARNEALFLTDKMAYELNLTDEQYEAAYEINLDYLMGVTSYDDVYGNYWERRNRDLSYILLDAQWQAYIAASYFYRPLYWSAGYWHFGIYARYPHRDYFYFGRPAFYATYRGAHAWHLHGSHGYYYSYRHHYRPAGRTHYGMLDRWNRGDYRRHHGGTIGRHGGTIGHHSGLDRHHDGRLSNQGTGHSRGSRGTFGNGDTHRHSDNFGGPRTSSTRTTVNNDRVSHHNSSGSFSGSGSRSNSSFGSSHSSGSFGSSRSSGSFSGTRSSGSFGGGRSSGAGSVSRGGGFGGGGSRGGSSHSGGSRSGGSFGSRR